MKLSFFKYQGTGNDFILIDDRSCFFPFQDVQTIQILCCRSRGIGADGVVLLQPSNLADFRIRIFNSDGSEAAMCGNGFRCLILYLKDLGFQENSFQIETECGVLSSTVQGNTISVKMPPPKVLHWELKLEGGAPFEVFVVHTGVPHAVIFVEELEEYPVMTMARFIRFHPYFGSEGVNVNFVERMPDGTFHNRTYERGVEGETLSCGTGSAACAFVSFQKGLTSSPARIFSKSGDCLEFAIKESLENGFEIEMKGKAFFVFKGVIEI